MNTTIIAAAFVSLAFAPMACAHRSMDDDGKVIRIQGTSHESSQRGWLGVSIDEVTSKLAKREGLKVNEGVYVRSVQKESPADHAGIKKGDVIVEYDGRKVYDENDLIDEVRGTKPGTEIPLTVNREGDTKILKATVERYRGSRSYSFTVPPPPQIRVAPRIHINKHSIAYGLTLEELNRQLGQYFGAPNGHGVLVKEVERESDGEKAGFKAGDVILMIGKVEVIDVEDVWDGLEEYKGGEKADIEILRKGAKQKLSLTIRERALSRQHFYWHGDDDDVIIDLPPEEESHLQFESQKLRRDLQEMGRDLRENMMDLKKRLKKEFRDIRRSVTI